MMFVHLLRFYTSGVIHRCLVGRSSPIKFQLSFLCPFFTAFRFPLLFLCLLLSNEAATVTNEGWRGWRLWLVVKELSLVVEAERGSERCLVWLKLMARDWLVSLLFNSDSEREITGLGLRDWFIRPAIGWVGEGLLAWTWELKLVGLLFLYVTVCSWVGFVDGGATIVGVEGWC